MTKTSMFYCATWFMYQS